MADFTFKVIIVGIVGFGTNGYKIVFLLYIFLIWREPIPVLFATLNAKDTKDGFNRSDLTQFLRSRDP